MAFLKLGVSARGVGMADAMSAAVTGAASMHYNPAGLVSPVVSSELLVMHKEWIQDTRTEYLGASFALGEAQALGLAVNSTRVEGIEIRTRPGPTEGTFTAQSLSIGLSFAHGFTDELRAGVTAKFLYEKIFVDEASGFAFDAGIQWNGLLNNLTLGAALLNAGAMNDLRNESTTLPMMIRGGGAYRIPIGTAEVDFLASADLQHIFPEGNTYLNLGGEITYRSLFSVRGGYQVGSEARGLSLGAEVRYMFLGVGYAFSRLNEDLGNGHTISVLFSL